VGLVRLFVISSKCLEDDTIIVSGAAQQRASKANQTPMYMYILYVPLQCNSPPSRVALFTTNDTMRYDTKGFGGEATTGPCA